MSKKGSVAMKIKLYLIQLFQSSSRGAFRDCNEWFLHRFPEGEADFQDILNALVEDDRPDDADWILDKFKSDSGAVMEVESIADCKHFFAAGHLIIKDGATVSGRLRAGRGIQAGKGIQAGEGIQAGWSIQAGEGIASGKGIKSKGNILAGCGIQAGDGIQAAGNIRAEWGIQAGTRIKAGCGIKAGLGIQAGLSIWAGRDFGIFAGLCVNPSEWMRHAQVISKSKPENLVSGYWVEPVA